MFNDKILTRLESFWEGVVELPCTIKKVRIVNFKSFKEVEVSLKQFNVLIGPNASGKTNFIEFFKFLKKALVETRRPYMPYIEWWNYRNLVWSGKEDLPIEGEIECEINGYHISYSVSFSGIGGIFRILHEKFNIKGFLTLEKEGQVLKIIHDSDFINKNAAEIEKFKLYIERYYGGPFKEIRKLSTNDILEKTVTLPTDDLNLLNIGARALFPLPSPSRSKLDYGFIRIPGYGISKFLLGGLIILPSHKRRPYLHSLDILLNEFREALTGFTILKHPNVQAIREPSPPRETRVLLEDASNLSNILNTWFMERKRFPERIEKALSKLFPKTQMSISLTAQGQVFIKVHENGVELDPPCISDGFYKVLAILTAIESNPSLLAIDEIENSLHAKTLEYIIDELKSSGVTVIITTHSPVVVDMVDLEDLLIAEKTSDGTRLSSVKEPDELRKKLKELNITQSESWLYGVLAG